MDFSRFPLHKKQVIVTSPSLVLIPSVPIFSHKPSAPDQTPLLKSVNIGSFYSEGNPFKMPSIVSAILNES